MIYWVQKWGCRGRIKDGTQVSSWPHVRMALPFTERDIMKGRTGVAFRMGYGGATQYILVFLSLIFNSIV